VARRPSFLGALARGILWGGLVLAGVFAGLVALYTFVDPVSTLMAARTLQGKPYERISVRLADVAPAAVAAVIASEDATFCHNDGVDWGALHEVMRGARGGEPKRGASTITMQTAKNLFLWPGRSVLRKGFEIGMALVLDKAWSKRRVMEIYLNVAEWGEGLYGIEAPSRRYFHKPASRLDAREGALLATALPNPLLRDPSHPRAFQRLLAARVMARAAAMSERLGCLTR
jgi:monofunctional glycosyltransferase